jgi:zinc protease
VDVDAVTEAVAATFGALPPRPAPTPVPDAERAASFPAGSAKPVVLTHKGRADQAIGYVAWPAPDFWSAPQAARNDAVMGEVMGLRLIEQLRQAQGVTYSPSVGYQHSLTWKDWGYVSAAVEVPPAKLDGFFADLDRIAADLRAKGPTADELERAKTPREDQIAKAQQTNRYWLSELSGAQADPRRLDAIRQLLPGTERVTAADVQRSAQRLLQDGKAWRLEVRPAK